jgi:prevent-host-death family protein
MAFEIILAPTAASALKNLSVPVRTEVTKALEVHLTHEPTKVSKSRIKRLRGLSQPQYRLRLATSACSMTLQNRKSKSSRSSRRPKRRRGSIKKARQHKAPKEVALAEVKDDLSKYLRLAVDEEIVITRHGRPAGILIGFGSEDDWFEYRLAHHPEFLRRIEDARTAIRAGEGIPLRDLR